MSKKEVILHQVTLHLEYTKIIEVETVDQAHQIGHRLRSGELDREFDKCEIFVTNEIGEEINSFESEVEEGAPSSCYFNAVEFVERGLEGGEGFYGYLEGDASSYVGPFKTSQEALAAVKLAHNGN